MHPVQREMPRAESILRKVICQDIPELTVCRVKAQRGTVFLFNRGGTVEHSFIPNAELICVGDGVFLLNAECKMQNAEWAGKASETKK